MFISQMSGPNIRAKVRKRKQGVPRFFRLSLSHTRMHTHTHFLLFTRTYSLTHTHSSISLTRSLLSLSVSFSMYQSRILGFLFREKLKKKLNQYKKSQKTFFFPNVMHFDFLFFSLTFSVFGSALINFPSVLLIVLHSIVCST